MVNICLTIPSEAYSLHLSQVRLHSFINLSAEGFFNYDVVIKIFSIYGYFAYYAVIAFT